MAAEHFWAFGGNKGTNKKIRKHESFKEYQGILKLRKLLKEQ